MAALLPRADRGFANEPRQEQTEAAYFVEQENALNPFFLLHLTNSLKTESHVVMIIAGATPKSNYTMRLERAGRRILSRIVEDDFL